MYDDLIHGQRIHSFCKGAGLEIFMCFLDIRQAFDRVWQDLLMVKLYRKGVNISLLKAVINLYEDMYSCVRTQGFTSDWFPVKQGTRQGGCLSPYLYLVLITIYWTNLTSTPTVL